MCCYHRRSAGHKILEAGHRFWVISPHLSSVLKCLSQTMKNRPRPQACEQRYQYTSSHQVYLHLHHSAFLWRRGECVTSISGVLYVTIVIGTFKGTRCGWHKFFSFKKYGPNPVPTTTTGAAPKSKHFKRRRQKNMLVIVIRCIPL